MTDIKTTLIVTVYNEVNNISRFLESVYSQTVRPDEIIITDANSIDGTQEILQSFRVRYGASLHLELLNERVNIAKGRNIAISKAQYDLILVTDAGCHLDANWVKEIIRPFQENWDEVDVVGGWYEAYFENDEEKYIAESYVPTLDEIDRENFLPSSRSIAFKKKCWSSVGGYPEKLTMSAEDTVFDISLKNTGFRFVFNEKAIAFWETHHDWEKVRRQYYNYGYGEGEAHIYQRRYIFRVLLLLFPFLMYFTKKRFKNFRLRYLIYCALVYGWFCGYFKIPLVTGLK